MPLRIAENFIESNLKVEGNDVSEKYSKKLSQMVAMSQFDQLKKQYDKESKAESMASKYESRFNKNATLDARRKSEHAF